MYLLDSNILIYYLEGKHEVCPFVEEKKRPIFISTISVAELLAKPALKKTQLAAIEHFLKNFSLIEFDNKIAKRTAALKRKYGIRLPDAIIAATAATHRLTLISRDSIFKKIREIKLKNPFQHP